MRIISWNVNGIRACSKKGLFQFLSQQSPDVVCLQETKAFREQCEEIEADLSSFVNLWHSAQRPGYSGVANLHRVSPLSCQEGCGISEFDREGRVLVTEHDDFFLMNMYFPNGGSGEDRHFFKMSFLEKIVPFFKEIERKKPLVLTGDFNIAHRAIDIHDPVRLDGESGFKPEERAWMDRFVREGFVDCFRLKHGDVKDQYSWWSYRQGARGRNKGWRIDYFFVSESLAPRVKRCEMLKNVEGSDHCPLLLEIF